MRVLVVCTGNSARSIMAEAVLNGEGLGRIAAFSAGSRPQEAPHPLALGLLHDLDYDASSMRSKCWNEFLGPNAPELDLVITVCDDAASGTEFARLRDGFLTQFAVSRPCRRRPVPFGGDRDGNDTA